jgi:signal recognition particle subunit SRP54
VAQITGRQVMFASNGEKLTDFDVFHPDRMASRILGMGDMLTLIEQAEKAFDADEAMAAAEKLQSSGGKAFTLDDFLQQMQAVRKMGSLSKIFGMIPGMGDFKEQIASIDDKDIDRIQAIILSMTPAERNDPKIIDGSRRQRISKGSGTSVSEVNSLVDRFFEARKMMSQMAGGGGMPGMPGMPGWASGQGQAAVQEGRPGQAAIRQPAKRAMLEKQAAARAAGQPPEEVPFELPKDLKGLL